MCSAPKPQDTAGFSKLTRHERFQRLQNMGVLSAADVQRLRSETSDQLIDIAENCIENVLGCFAMPLGVAVGHVIDGQSRVIPMAVEETSIIAAQSKTAKWIAKQGEIRTEKLGTDIVGQLQLATVSNFQKFEQTVQAHAAAWVAQVNAKVTANLCTRGGGVKRIEARCLPRPDGQDMAVLHVYMDPCDAMGANLINQACEYLRGPVARATGETVDICILSNLVDQCCTKSTVMLQDIGPDLAARIENASLFAEIDPYRAATHNKGILNGIDAVLLATGNDWRAVDAALHAYAARDGQYRGLSRWRAEGGDLIGEMTVPIQVGTVGGMTKIHPTAHMSLRMLGVDTAAELCRIVAAVGLVQNLGALRALATEGIVEGHMKLHLNNLVLASGAKQKERPLLLKELETVLRKKKKITLSDAEHLLVELRQVMQAKSVYA